MRSTTKPWLSSELELVPIFAAAELHKGKLARQRAGGTGKLEFGGFLRRTVQTLGPRTSRVASFRVPRRADDLHNEFNKMQLSFDDHYLTVAYFAFRSERREGGHVLPF